MKTNRDEILESAFQLFMAMNYERVSLQMITKKVGLTKTGIFNYYPTKLDLFIAVADKFLFKVQDPKTKYEIHDGTFRDFIQKYVQGVKNAMAKIVNLGNLSKEIMPGKSPNAGYLHLLQQVRLYYPDGAGKLQKMIENDKEHWRVAIHAAVKNGELRKDIDVENVILLYHHVFMGMSYEMSLFNGLDTDLLYSSFMCLYDGLKQ